MPLLVMLSLSNKRCSCCFHVYAEKKVELFVCGSLASSILTQMFLLIGENVFSLHMMMFACDKKKLNASVCPQIIQLCTGIRIDVRSQNVSSSHLAMVH